MLTRWFGTNGESMLDGHALWFGALPSGAEVMTSPGPTNAGALPSSSTGLGIESTSQLKVSMVTGDVGTAIAGAPKTNAEPTSAASREPERMNPPSQSGAQERAI